MFCHNNCQLQGKFRFIHCNQDQTKGEKIKILTLQAENNKNIPLILTQKVLFKPETSTKRPIRNF